MQAKTIIIADSFRARGNTATQADVAKAAREPGVVRATLLANHAAMQTAGAEAGANAKQLVKQGAVYAAAAVGTLTGSVAAFAKGLWN